MKGSPPSLVEVPRFPERLGALRTTGATGGNWVKNLMQYSRISRFLQGRIFQVSTPSASMLQTEVLVATFRSGRDVMMTRSCLRTKLGNDFHLMLRVLILGSTKFLRKKV